MLARPQPLRLIGGHHADKTTDIKYGFVGNRPSDLHHLRKKIRRVPPPKGFIMCCPIFFGMVRMAATCLVKIEESCK